MWPENFSEPQFNGEHPEEELAAFALNALDDAEFQAVFHHVVRCLHCQEVLLGFRETAARLTEAVAEVDLPPGLKGRALAGAVGQNAGSGAGAAAGGSTVVAAATAAVDGSRCDWSVEPAAGGVHRVHGVAAA